MSKTEKIAFEKSLIGQEVSWTDTDGESVGIIIELGEDEGVYVQKCMELEGMEVTNDICFIPVEDVKLRTFVVAEKMEGDFSDGAIVSWETSAGTYYGDIQASSTDGTVRGEPQGLEIEGTPERPAYVVRVWQASEDEWEPTNVTIVAYGDNLKVEEELPGLQEDESEEQDPEDVPTEEVMPSRAPKGGGKKNMDEKVIANIVAEVLVKYFAAQEESKSDATEEVVVAEEVAVEVKSEEVEVAAEVAAEDASVAEVAAEEVVAEVSVEEVAAEEVAADAAAEAPAEDAPAAEEAVEEKSSISFDELKEFHALIKVL
jgi:hypothetical protein